MKQYDEYGNPIQPPGEGPPPDPNLPPEPMPEGWTPAPELPPEPMPEGWTPASELPPEPMPEGWTPASELPPEPMPEPEPAPDPTNSWGCTPRATAAVIAIIAVLVIAWFALDDGGSDDDAAPAPTTSTTAAPSTTTTAVAAAPAEGVPPDPDSLPAGAVLYQGESGGPIGNIAEDGQSRFLSLDRPGLGVGDGSIADQATTWDDAGRVTAFGVTLGTSANVGRYGINLFIDGTTYGVGCAIEVGETACSAVPENLSGAAPLAAGQSLTIIVGEEGHVEATGAYPLSWWFVFQPT